VTSRVGLGISRDSVRAVLVRNGRVIWTNEATIANHIDIRSAIEETLRSLPRSRGPRRRVLAAVGPSQAQLKRLTTVASTNDTLLGEAVSANAGRFFLRNGVPWRVTCVRREHGGSAWIAAIEAPVAAAIEDACGSLRLRYKGAVPSLAVLQKSVVQAAESQTVFWQDTDVIGELTIEHGLMLRAARSAPNGDCPIGPPLVPSLRELNGSGWRLADAYAAALTDGHDALVLRPLADAVRQRRRSSVRRGVLVALCASIALSGLFAPGLMAERAQARGSARLAELAARQTEVSAAQLALAQVTRALERGSEFANRRRRVLEFLAEVTERAPVTTAVLNLRVDSAGGTILALSPHGAELFAAVGQLPLVKGARITAQLTRETVESGELERVVLRFDFVDAIRDAKPTRKSR
jgi:hypothetical protein